MRKLKSSGFFYGYIIVAVSFMLQAAGIGIFNSLGVFLKPLMTEFGWSRALIASTISIGMLVVGTSAIVLGRLSDRYGPRLIMTICGCFMGGGFILLSSITSIWHMYIYLSLLASIGLGGTDVILLSTTTRWFVRKRGMMMGIVKVGTGVGMLIMPLLINYLISDFGWRKAFIALGVICLAAYALGSQLLIRDPEKMGVQPDGIEGDVHQNGEAVEQGITLRKAIRTSQFWTICGLYFIILFCSGTILIHVIPHAIDLGISPSNAANILATVGAMSIAGRFIMGSAGDRIGNRLSLIISFGFVITGMVWLLFSRELWMLYLFAAVHGFAHGAFYALLAPVTADYFGTRYHGVILGIVIFASTVGGSIGPVLAGYMFDVTGSYRIIFMLLTAMSAAGVFASYSLRPIDKVAA